MARVSVIIPTYNRADFCAQAIRSVQAQTYGDLEMIVVDDASTDNTVEVVEKLALEDDRIRLFQQPENRRVNAARNLGLQQAGGEFVNYLDSDDLFAPEKLARQVAAFDEDPELDAVICQSLMFQDNPETAEFVWKHLDHHLTDSQVMLERFLRFRFGWSFIAPLWKRTFLQEVGPSPESFGALDDKELYVRILCRQPKIRILPDALAYVRLHEQPSGRNSFKEPFKMRFRFRALVHIEGVLQSAGADTAENRRSMSSSFLRLARAFARKRMARSAFQTLTRAARSAPGLGRKLAITVSGLIVLPAILLTGQRFPRLQRVFLKLGIEYPSAQFMQERYVPPEEIIPSLRED